MKTAKDCIYITPCGFCSRKKKECKELVRENKRAAEELEKKYKEEKAPWE